MSWKDKCSLNKRLIFLYIVSLGLIGCAKKIRDTSLGKISDKPVLTLSYRDSNNNPDRFFPLIRRIVIGGKAALRFGKINKVLFDEQDSLLFILDRHTIPGIYVYNTMGHFLRKIGRTGHGPGEYFDPIDFCLLPPKRIALFERGNRRCIIYNYTGEVQKYFLLKIDDRTLIYPSAAVYLDDNFVVYRGYAPTKYSPLFYAFDQTGRTSNTWGTPSFYNYVDISVESDIMGTTDSCVYKADLYSPEFSIFSKTGRVLQRYQLEYSSSKKAREFQQFKARFPHLNQREKGQKGFRLERIKFLHVTSRYIFIMTPENSLRYLLFSRKGDLLYYNSFPEYQTSRGTLSYEVNGDISNPTGEIAAMVYHPVGRWSKGVILGGVQPVNPDDSTLPGYEIRFYRYPDTRRQSYSP